MTSTDKITDPFALAACCVMYMLAPVGMTLLPLMVGSATDSLGLTQLQTGFLASTDVAGIAVASVICAIWIRKVPWRPLAVWGILIIVIGNGVCLLADDFLVLCVLRFVTEFGHGIIFSLAIASIGDSNKPDRYFAIGIALTIFISMILFLILPDIIQSQGRSVVFISGGLVAIMTLPAVLWFPAQAVARRATSIESHGSVAPLFIAMVAFGFFYASEGGIWAYIERIGNAAGYSSGFIGKTLVASQIASVLGALVVSWLSTRVGRIAPLVLGLIAYALSLMLFLVEGVAFYVAAACLTQFFVIFLIPYFLLVCVELDPTSRLYVLTTAFKLAGMSAAPSIIALFLTEGNYAAVSWVGTGFLIIALLLITPLIIKLDREHSIAHATLSISK